LENTILNEVKALALPVLPLSHLPMETAFLAIPLHSLFGELNPTVLRLFLPSYYRPQQFY